MTTPILPTRSQLRAYALSPTELIRDQQVEEILAEHYTLLAGMLAAWRNGEESYTYTAISTGVAAVLRAILKDEYGYWVATVPSSREVDFSWAETNPYL